MPNDSEYTPTTDQIRFRVEHDWEPYGDGSFDRWLAEYDREVAAKAWAEGHKTRWRRDWDDGCHCYASSSGECACGNYGTGELLSLNDNPYRGAPEQEGEK